MNKKTKKIMQGIGAAMAVGSVVAAASASMPTNGKNSYKKAASNAMDKVNNFVNNVQSMMK